jgi:hypothetical protein
MRAKIFGRIPKVWAITFMCLTMSACKSMCNGNGLEGTYHHTSGAPITLDFKGNKVTFTVAGESKTLDYKVDGNKVTIINPQEGDVVLTRNADGSLSAPVGTFAKKGS